MDFSQLDRNKLFGTEKEFQELFNKFFMHKVEYKGEIYKIGALAYDGFNKAYFIICHTQKIDTGYGVPIKSILDGKEWPIKVHYVVDVPTHLMTVGLHYTGKELLP